jgi:aminopeptidase N
MFKIRPAIIRPSAVAAFILLITMLQSCRDRKVNNDMTLKYFENEDPERLIASEFPAYRPVVPKVVRLIHTKLNLEPNFENSTMKGEARISMVPHFYKTDSIELDAKCFTLAEVSLSRSGKPLKHSYTYDKEKIKIKLEKEISRTDTIICYVKYIAKPDSCETGGSAAIISNKGLFFINPDGKDKFKPRQLWTQGETSYNSRWFPTIESPDQKMTQEISITIDTGMVSLSNGLLVSSAISGASKRTDTWVQSKAAAPYLTMIAVGDFEITKEKWRGIEVSYYLEPEYSRYAKKIFGETPKMLDFFSEKFGVTYPWEKYSQIVVRDYVSGAMENTTATIHGESVQRTDRELIDENAEDIISHELSHHWFGDLVTCESWSNLPLNESFATYSEYLWLEYRHGKEEADRHRMFDLSNYLSEAEQKQVGLFRPYYQSEEEMFDAHSYQKGGLVLHYLRKVVGDEAFFEILKRYLVKHAYSTAEIPDLRQVTEEVTGLDYNWFFDQWFYLSGHPILEIEQRWNDTTKATEITIQQLQQTGNSTYFRLPMDVHIWTGQEKKVERIILQESRQTFSLPGVTKPNLVAVDPERWVPSQRLNRKDSKEWAMQFSLESSYPAKMEALQNLSALEPDDEERDLVIKALNDPTEGIRLAGIEYYAGFMEKHKNAYKNQLIQLAMKDEKTQVRKAALELLHKHFSEEAWLIKILADACTEQSYLLASTALMKLNTSDPTLAFEMAKRTEKDTNLLIIKSIASIYAHSGSDSENAFFAESLKRISGFEKYELINIYGQFLPGRSDSIIRKGIIVLEEEARKNPIWFVRLEAVNVLTEIEQLYSNRSRELKLQAGNTKTGENNIRIKSEFAEKMSVELKALIREIKASETNINLRNIYLD